MPTISVIVPVYKVEKYIHRCVDSILGQTFIDFELILVDDGSPDNCPAICDEYAEKDNRVHVIHQENGGLSAARNAGIDWAFANSDSQWLSFIDSDDWVHPEYLERLLDAAAENNVDLSICGYKGTSGEEVVCFEKQFDVTLWTPKDFYTSNEINATIAWGKLYRKECFDTIRYPVGKIHEDEYTTYKILFEQDSIVYIAAPLYAYYNNPDGITKSKWSIRRLDLLEALEERILYFTEGNDEYMVDYCQKQLLGCSSLLYLQARANHALRYFPKKYGLSFLKAAHTLEAACGTDRYESLMVRDYPVFIRLQAYGRKIKHIFGSNKS